MSGSSGTGQFYQREKSNAARPVRVGIATSSETVKTPGIPPPAVGGWFRSCLQTKAARCFLESHPREWVDCSSAAYSWPIYPFHEFRSVRFMSLEEPSVGGRT
jgi:hypothetical protein